MANVLLACILKAMAFIFHMLRKMTLEFYSCIGTTDSYGTPFRAQTELFVGGIKHRFYS